ncbi:SRPBCC family protein [soil metagenome]
MDKNYSLTLPSDTQIVMERNFDAPRELVFRAYTDPELVPQWWGLRTATTTVDKLDLRVGGEWRWVQTMPDGTEYGFHGEYRLIDPPSKLVSTFEFEGMPGHVIEDTAVFSDLDGKTRLTVTSNFASKEDRDGMIASGMEGGAIETWDRLSELLVTLV